VAKKSMMAKMNRQPKFSVRGYNRCKICGRPHAYMVCAVFVSANVHTVEKFRE